MVANDGGLPDDDARAMVDAEILTDLCPRMDVDACV